MWKLWEIWSHSDWPYERVDTYPMKERELRANKCFLLAKTDEAKIMSNSYPSDMHGLYYMFFSYNENRRVMDIGYPKYISEDFPGLNTTINAAIHKEGKLVFFV